MVSARAEASRDGAAWHLPLRRCGGLDEGGPRPIPGWTWTHGGGRHEGRHIPLHPAHGLDESLLLSLRFLGSGWKIRRTQVAHSAYPLRLAASTEEVGPALPTSQRRIARRWPVQADRRAAGRSGS